MPRKAADLKYIKAAPTIKLADRLAVARKEADEQIAELVIEMSLLADKALVQLIKDGVPVASLGNTPQTAAYVSALTLAMKRTGKLVEKQEIEHSGEIRAAVILPVREIVQPKQ